MGCGWPGCPCADAPFNATRLLRHAREAHAGQLDEARLGWADAVICPHCSLPLRGLQSHFIVDPSSGERRCPRLVQPRTVEYGFTDADRRFAAALTREDIFVQPVSSIPDIPADAVPHYAACLGPLLEQYLTTGTIDDFKFFLVVWITLVRPTGKQRSPANALIRRCRMLAQGGQLDALFNDVPALRQPWATPHHGPTWHHAP